MGGSYVQGAGMDENDKTWWQNGWVKLFGPAIAIVVLLLFFLTLRLGEVLWETIGAFDPAEKPVEALRGLGWLFGALVGGLIAAGFGVWRGAILEKQTKVARDQYERSLDRDYADLFTKAVEQLGTTREERGRNDEGKEVYTYKPNIEVRLGAIYALERISQVSERDHIAVMETLCAYVRENAPASEAPVFVPPEGEPEDEMEAAKWWEDVYRPAFRSLLSANRPRADIQAVLTVLGRRREDRIAFELREEGNKRRYTLDLRNSNLINADLNRARFNNANMEGSHMQGAQLLKANLQFTNLIDTNLQKARLIGADLQKAFLSFNNLQEAQLEKANLKSARLDAIHLDSAVISFADFTDADDLSRHALEAAFGCAGTVLPDYAKAWRPQHWYPQELQGLVERISAYDEWQTARAARKRPFWVDEGDWRGWPGGA